MKFTVNQDALTHSLSLVGRAVPSRPTHPVLANILVRATSDRIHLTAFDLSLGIQTSLPAEVEVEGETTLPAKLFSDIVSRLPSGEIEIVVETTEDAIVATIKSNTGTYTVRGMAAGEYPELPEIEGDAIALTAEDFLDIVNSTLFASSTDESKQVLTGIRISIEAEMEAAATDGHRLAVASQSILSSEAINSSAEFHATIPAKSLRELQKLAVNTESISLKMDGTVAVFEIGDRILTTRLIEGQYPNYRQLIPKQFSTTVLCDRRLLLSALDRVSVLADQKNGVVKFEIQEQELVLSCEAQDLGGAREAIAVSVSGPALQLAFNGKYVVDALKAMQGSEVQINLNLPTSPVVFEPLGGVKMVCLIMPIQIRS